MYVHAFIPGTVIISGCFRTTTAELDGFNEDHLAHKF